MDFIYFNVINFNLFKCFLFIFLFLYGIILLYENMKVGIVMPKLNDKKMINDIRCLALDMIHEAGSGHPGIAL